MYSNPSQLPIANATHSVPSKSMASTVLPQALYMFPRNPTQIQLKTLGFSSSFSCYPTAFNSTRVSISRISPNTPIVQKLSHKSFIVQAESNSEAEPENIEENGAVVDSEAPEAVPELESEVAKPPRKPRVKLGDIMGILNKRAVEESEKERPIPDIRTGDVVEIKLEVPENRRRLSVYKGIVISKQNAGIHTTIRIRRIIAGIGVEIVFPVYSPNIKELRVLSHRKVRRARLYYLRDKLPRLSTFK